MHWNEMVLTQLPPDVALFVDNTLRRMEAAGICDAPGVVSGVLSQMRSAESGLVRAAAPLVEVLMISALSRRLPTRISA